MVGTTSSTGTGSVPPSVRGGSLGSSHSGVTGSQVGSEAAANDRDVRLREAEDLAAGDGEGEGHHEDSCVGTASQDRVAQWMS